MKFSNSVSIKIEELVLINEDTKDHQKASFLLASFFEMNLLNLSKVIVSALKPPTA